jgi:hypothetical protein
MHHHHTGDHAKCQKGAVVIPINACNTGLWLDEIRDRSQNLIPNLDERRVVTRMFTVNGSDVYVYKMVLGR